jgi:glycopeptide antibiotics resistance protein
VKGRSLARALLLAWIGAIVAILVPWRDLTGHTHWQKVTWTPFAPPIRPLDILANVLAFVPCGLLWRWSRFERAWLRLPAALLVAAIVSLTGEALQLYSHWRFPSATDVVANLTGVIVGWRVPRGDTRAF